MKDIFTKHMLLETGGKDAGDGAAQGGASASAKPGSGTEQPSFISVEDFSKQVAEKKVAGLKYKVDGKEVTIPVDQLSTRLGQDLGISTRWQNVSPALKKLGVDPASPTFEQDLQTALGRSNESYVADLLARAKRGDTEAQAAVERMYGPMASEEPEAPAEVDDVADFFKRNPKLKDDISEEVSPAIYALLQENASVKKQLRDVLGQLPGLKMGDDVLAEKVHSILANLNLANQSQQIISALRERLPPEQKFRAESWFRMIQSIAVTEKRPMGEVMQEVFKTLPQVAISKNEDIPEDRVAQLRATWEQERAKAAKEASNPPPGIGGQGLGGPPDIDPNDPSASQKAYDYWVQRSRSR